MRNLAGLVRTVAAAVACTCLPLSFGHAAELRVATFTCDLTPPLGSLSFPSMKPLENIEHPLLAKGIVLDDGQHRYVLCAVDWCEICNFDLRAILPKGGRRGRNRSDAGRRPFGPSAHGPRDRLRGDRTSLENQGSAAHHDPKLYEQMADRLGEAVKKSLAAFRPFDRIGTGEGRVDRVASTRRVMGKDGKIHPRWSRVTGKDLYLRDEPEGPIDPMLKTITLAHGDKPLVRLHFYACHPQSFVGDPRVSYDFPGMAREELQKKENVFQIYFTGCAGDILVGKYNDGTPARRRQFAQRLLAGMEVAIAATQFAPALTH